MTSHYYLEIAPMSGEHYTGVAQVAAALCEQALADQQPVHFMVGRSIVPRPVVERLVASRDGTMLNWYLQRVSQPLAPLREHFGSSIGVFTNRKFSQRLFDREVQFVHDLSPLVTPQFHTQPTVDFHQESYQYDICTNDLTVCDSDATAFDVRTYIRGVDPSRVRTIPLSYQFDAAALGLIDAFAAEGRPVEPYVVVLGTLEPRKNVRAVLELLARSPGLVNTARFLFIGRFGWGSSMHTAIEELGLSGALAKGRIVTTGFVPETVKNVLLHNAALVLYPSVFEGFGLPVLEALAAGVPVVTTRSSSIPEAGGDAAFYFDPFIDGDLDRAVYAALFDRGVAEERVNRGRAWMSRFDWPNSWKLLKSWIEQIQPITETVT